MKKFFMIALVAMFTVMINTNAKSLIVKGHRYNVDGFIGGTPTQIWKAKSVIPVQLYPDRYKPNQVKNGDWCDVRLLENGDIYVASETHYALVSKGKVKRLTADEARKARTRKTLKDFDYHANSPEQTYGYCYAKDKKGNFIVLVYDNN